MGKQYYLKLETDFGEAYGEGWYDENSYATILIMKIPLEGYLKCLEHTMNLRDECLKKNLGKINQIKMDSPKTLKAVWRQHIHLNISNHSNTSIDNNSSINNSYED